MQPSLSVVGGFFVRTLLMLGPALAAWFWAREWLVRPVAWLAEQTMLFCFPAWVYGAQRNGTSLELLTALRAVDASGRVGELSAQVNLLTYCYGLPMLLALLFAAKARGLWWKLPLGALLLLPFQVWGVCFDWLVKIAVHMGHLTAAATGFSSLQVNAFALAYQLGFLLLPTLVPVLVWLRLERRFLVTLVVDGALKGAVSRS
jgi:hypothetical protein